MDAKDETIIGLQNRIAELHDGHHREAQDLADERARVVELTDELNRATKRYGEIAELNNRNRKHADDADAEVLSLSAEVDALKGEAAYLRAECSGLARVVDALEAVIVRAVKG